MKIAILGDTHIGIRKDDSWIVKNQRKFFDFFFKECKSRSVEVIIQTGDFFDVRTGISQESLQFVREELVPEFQKIGHTYVLVGNHDMHLRDRIVPNSCREALGHYDDFTIIEESTTIRIDDVDFDMIPWICKENRKSIYSYIQNSKSPYCIGHFELSGFYYYTGVKSEGSKAGFLSDYKQVFSGHFHCRSNADNVMYVGTPYTLTLGDANDDRGFYIFDTETHTYEFVKNPDCWHKKVYFNADTFKLGQIKDLKNRAVRIIVEKRASEKRKIDFDTVTERISNVVHSLDILDNVEFIVDDEDVIIEVDDTQKFVDAYIEDMDEPQDIKDRCKVIFNTLQMESKALSE